MQLSTLTGVYDASGGDRWGDVGTLGSLIGRSIAYEGSDGQRHHGTITAICYGGSVGVVDLIAVFSSGYSDGHWMSLRRAVEALSD